MYSHESMQSLAEGIFWFFVLVTFCGAILAVSARTLIRRVAGLALCFTGVAGLYYYLSSPFVAFMQMLVYVGALCVTITFAIMLAETSDANRPPRRHKLSLFLGAVASCAITAALVALSIEAPWPDTPSTQIQGTIERIGQMLLSTYSMSFELISVVLVVAMVGALALARHGRDK